MPSVAANGIDIEYEVAGSTDDPPLLLIMGLGGQLIAWDDEFVSLLADRGFYVIRYDNRDIGRSTWLDSLGVPDIQAALTGGAFAAPYLLSDMSDDAADLLAALGFASAHVVGASMGGMIAQSLAIRNPPMVRTLTSIMSTTGDRSVGAPHPSAVGTLTMRVAPTREAALDAAVVAQKAIGSPGYPFDEERVRAKAGAAYDRGAHPAGMMRQFAAILASPDRTAGLGQVRVPTLVIHGEADPLIDPSGGRATAAAIPGASLWTIPGMGHDLPPQLFPEVTDRIAAHCAQG